MWFDTTRPDARRQRAGAVERDEARTGRVVGAERHGALVDAKAAGEVVVAVEDEVARTDLADRPEVADVAIDGEGTRTRVDCGHRPWSGCCWQSPDPRRRPPEPPPLLMRDAACTRSSIGHRALPCPD